MEFADIGFAQKMHLRFIDENRQTVLEAATEFILEINLKFNTIN